MKKLLIFIITSILIFSLSSCIEETNKDEDNIRTLNIICCLEEKTYTQTLKINDDYVLDDFIPSIKGYEFQGWYLNPDEEKIVADLDDLINQTQEDNPHILNVYPKLVKTTCTITINVYGATTEIEWPINSYLDLHSDIGPSIIEGIYIVYWNDSDGVSRINSRYITSDTVFYGYGNVLDGYVSIPIFDGDKQITNKFAKTDRYLLLEDIKIEDKFNYKNNTCVYEEFRGFRVKNGNGETSKHHLYVKENYQIETVYHKVVKDKIYNNTTNKFYKENPTDLEIENGILCNGFDAISNSTVYCVYYVDPIKNEIISTTGFQYPDIKDGEKFKISLKDLAVMAKKNSDASFAYFSDHYDKYNYQYYYSRDEVKNGNDSQYENQIKTIYLPTDEDYDDLNNPYGYLSIEPMTINIYFVSVLHK